MSQPRNRPSVKEWAERKPQIELLYLEENRTLEEVSSILAEDNFHATIRQYKTRLKAWGYDSKKIRGEVWKAMSMMISQLKRHHMRLVFVVPFRGGQHKDITQDLISKQMRRTTAQLRDISAAIEVLEQNGVKIVCTDVTTGKQTHHSPSEFDTNTPTNYEVTLSALPAIAAKASVTTTPSSSRSGLSNQVSPSIAFHNTPHHSYSYSSIHSWPASPSAGQRGRSATITQPSDQRTSFSPLEDKQNSEDFDIMSAFGQLCVDNECSPVMREALQRYVGTIFPSNTASALTEEKRLATEWMAYYILTLDSKQDSTRTDHEADRTVAMNHFQRLLTHHSRFIFPFCNSVIMVLGCDGSNGHLQEFLDDCCEVIDKHMDGQELNYGSPFHLTRALWLGKQEDIAEYEQTFERSTTTIGAIWGTDSPNYIVNRHYYAWLQLHNQNRAVAIDLLLNLIPEAKKILGDTHPLTVNCYATLSRAYEESGDLQSAFVYLHKALETLDHTSKLLQKYIDRLRRRLALLHRNAGNIPEAEKQMMEIILFRIEYFGIRHEVTWNVIMDLVTMLRSYGRNPEADCIYQDMNHRYLRDVCRVQAVANSGELPGWVCRYCENPTCERDCVDALASSSSKATGG